MPTIEEQLLALSQNSKKGSDLPVATAMSNVDKYMVFKDGTQQFELVPRTLAETGQPTLTAYATHALAVAAEPSGADYLLTEGNIEGVNSDGISSPIFRVP